MSFVALPSDNGWHYVDPDQIIGVQAIGDKKCEVLLNAGLALSVCEESYAVYKRLESHLAQGSRTGQSAPRANFAKTNGNGQQAPRSTW